MVDDKEIGKLIIDTLKDSKNLKLITDAIKDDASKTIQALLDGTWKEKLPGLETEVGDKVKDELTKLLHLPGDTLKNLQSIADVVNTKKADIEKTVGILTTTVDGLAKKAEGVDLDRSIIMPVKELELTKRKSWIAGFIQGIITGIGVVAAILTWIVSK